MGLKIDNVAHLLPFVKPSHTTIEEEGVVYESFLPESRQVGDESLSMDEFFGCENVGLEHPKESVLNIDRVGDIDVVDSDDSKPILRFKRTKPTWKPVETPHPHRFKTTTSPTVPLNVPLPRPRTCSLSPLILLPLLDDVIESRGKRKQSTPKSAKTAQNRP